MSDKWDVMFDGEWHNEPVGKDDGEKVEVYQPELVPKKLSDQFYRVFYQVKGRDFDKDTDMEIWQRVEAKLKNAGVL